jgi:SAM-dependent methyltransferase
VTATGSQTVDETAPNVDPKTVHGFGREWAAFDQTHLDREERNDLFEKYFGIFDVQGLAEGFDFGCGSGRWAVLVAPQVGTLHCIDASPEALDVARTALAGLDNVRFHLSGPDDIPLADDSQDFGYSLGVLHHIPDTEAAMRACVAKLKPGGRFLVYLYYSFDQRPAWFKLLWRVSEIGRRGISRLPFPVRRAMSEAIAASVYYPFSRLARFMERRGADVSNMPLSFYRSRSFYSMRTDALDRFGTRLEQRFSRPQIEAMMRRCGLVDIAFSPNEPYWVACGVKAAAA